MIYPSDVNVDKQSVKKAVAWQQEYWLYLPVLLAPWILLAPVIFTDKALFWGTPFLQFVPWRVYAWESLRQGVFPLWNPLVGMGAPLLANYQSALFYPPNILLLALQMIGGTPAQAWGQAVSVALHLTWAGLGMILLTRELRMRPASQAISAAAFAMSGYLVSRSGFLSINAAAAWMPWIIWSIQRTIKPYLHRDENLSMRDVFRLWLPFILSLGMQLLAGHAQTTWYTLLLAAAWMVWTGLHSRNQRIITRWFPSAIAAGVLAAALAAIQLIPTAEYLLQSQRASAVEYDFAMNYSLDPWSLITFLAPDIFGNPARGDYWLKIYFWETAIYIGLIPFILAISAGMRAFLKKTSSIQDDELKTFEKDRCSLSRFLLLITAVSILIALGKNTPIFPWLYRYIPTFAMFQAPVRFSIWAVFALSLLAGIGLETWRQPEGRWLYWARLLTAGAFAVSLGSGLTWYFLREVRPTFIQATAMAGLWALVFGFLTLIAPSKEAPATRPWWKWALVTWVTLDLMVAGWGLNPGADISLYQGDPGDGYNASLPVEGKRIYLPEMDENSLKFDRFFKSNSLSMGGSWSDLRNGYLPDANILAGIPSANNFDPLVPGRYATWIEYVNNLSAQERLPWLNWMDVSAVERVDTDASSGITFERVENSARLHWSTCAVYAPDGASAWEMVQRQMAGDQRDDGWAVIENVKSELQKTCNSKTSAVMQIVEEKPDETIIQVGAPQEGWLVQSDVWYPGWRATLDGNSVPIYRANYLFRGVKIPEGRHTVKIEYRPLSFYAGLGISLIALVAILWAFSGKNWQR